MSPPVELDSIRNEGELRCNWFGFICKITSRKVERKVRRVVMFIFMKRFIIIIVLGNNFGFKCVY